MIKGENCYTTSETYVKMSLVPKLCTHHQFVSFRRCRKIFTNVAENTKSQNATILERN